VFPVLRTIDSVAEEPRLETDVQDPQELIRRASLALKELLGNLARTRSVVLFVDDLQWGDVDSARLLREVLAPPVIPALMVLVSYRLEETKNPTLKTLLQSVDSTSDGQVRFAVDVGPMERNAARDMIRSLVQGSPAVAQDSDQRRVDSMIDESEGNPYLLHEFAQHWSSGQDTTGVALEDVVRRRVALLLTSARVLLETVAVAGQPISQALALGAAGLSPDSDAFQV
jgi:predicted ATPase